MHEINLYLPTRTLYMGSEHVSETEGFAESGCDAFMAERSIKNLLILDSINNDPITIVMNNVGGDEYHGLAIYDAIKACQSKIVIKVFGHAMSMGSIILQAADERIMAPNAVQMIHYGYFSFSGHDKTFQKWAKEGEKLDKWMEQMYLKNIKEKQPLYTLARLQRLLDHDTFLRPQEAIDLGLADRILETK
jgi:ATP-dependent Clp endopeptidase proteolytic subunit ClpP